MARSTAETATKERILTAAIGVFARKGYHGAGVEDIVAAAAAPVAGPGYRVEGNSVVVLEAGSDRG